MNARDPKKEDNFARSVEENTPEPTEWTDIKAIYAKENNIVEDFIKEIMDAVPPDLEGNQTIAMPLWPQFVGDPGEERYMARLGLQFDFLREVEKEGGLQRLQEEVRSEFDDGWNNIIYAVFTCERGTLLPILLRHMQDIGKRRREARDKMIARDTICYRVTFEELDGRIIIEASGKQCVLIKPQSMKAPLRLFQYVYAHPCRRITKQELRRYGGYIPSATTQLKNHVHYLGFTGELKKLFFPHITKTWLEFRDSISQDDLSRIKIDSAELEKQLQNLKKI